jgi:hypothetical protein
MDTQTEAREIIRNAYADYKAGGIALWQLIEVYRRAFLDYILGAE